MASLKTPVTINGKKYWTIADVAKRLQTSIANVSIKVNRLSLGDKLCNTRFLAVKDIEAINASMRNSRTEAQLKKLFA